MPLRLFTGATTPGRASSSSDSPPGASAWVRGLLWTIGPAAPATALDEASRPLLRAHAAPAGRVELAIMVENHQGATSLLRPMLSPLAGPGGRQWSPVATVTPKPLILRAGERREVTIGFDLEPGAPPGEYRGRLFLLGVRSPPIEVVIITGPSE